MALIKTLTKDDRELKGLHPTVVDCRYIVAEKDSQKLLQLNTYGSDEREIPDKLSQTFQFDEVAARQLFDLLKDEFSFT